MNAETSRVISQPEQTNPNPSRRVPSKCKVAYVLHSLTLGGVEVALVSAVPRLCREFDLRIVCLGPIDPKLISHLSPNEKKAFVSFPSQPIKYAFAILSAIRYLLRFKPDLLVCSLWRASLTGVVVKKLRKSVRLLSFVHSTNFFHIPDRLFTTLALANADGILTDSKAVSDFVLRSFRPKVSIQKVSFFIQPTPPQRTNAPLNSGKGIRFIYLGRLDPVKNIPLAIDTIQYLRSEGIDASLDIFGRMNSYWDDIAAHIEMRNLEPFVQFKDELNPAAKLGIFKNYNFLIQMSRAEGMAMSVAEAMQNGVVCVVTPVGEIPNYSEDMKTAIFMDSSNSRSWQSSLKKIQRVCGSPELYETLSKNCWANFANVRTYADSLVAYLNSANFESNFDECQNKSSF